MKASEVLQRYAAGERNFQRVNLRGQSFKKQNLSGADFSEANIRETDFSGATLKGVKFVGVKAGAQLRWETVQLILSTAMFFLSLSLIVISSVFVIAFVLNVQSFAWRITSSIEIILFFILTLKLLLHQGFTVQALNSIIIVGAVGGVGVIAWAGAMQLAIAKTISDTIFSTAVNTLFAPLGLLVFGATVGISVVVLIVVFVGIITLAIAVNGVDEDLKSVYGMGGIIITLAGVVSWIVGNRMAGVSMAAVTTSMTVAIVGITMLASLHIARLEMSDSENFSFIRQFAVAFASLGGTRFYAADLAEADFTRATLKSTDFRQATLTCTCWKNAEKLDRARPENTILAKPAVRDLLVTGNGYSKDFSYINFSGANLHGANLENANLHGANLENATLEGTHLKNANLSHTLAIGTNFSCAYLTGATLEAWNIDSTTNLENVDCQYIFLLEHPNARGNRDRRPHDPDAVFQPGDFAQLYTKMMNVVQILLRDGCNPEVFRQAFVQLMAENPEITPESIQSFEKKGKDVLVTVTRLRMVGYGADKKLWTFLSKALPHLTHPTNCKLRGARSR